MRAWEIAAGSTDLSGLSLVERPDPKPEHDQIVVRVKAAAMNYRDLGVIAGRYFGGPVRRATIPFSDGAGEVVAVGSAVERFKVGDRVCGCFFRDWIGGPLTSELFPHQLGAGLDGMLAEQVVLAEEGAVEVPAHLSYEEAATLPCAALTAWNALIESGGLRAGETVLILGTGGVSIFALQIAKLSGARVIATSSSDAKLDRARALGADETINYRQTPNWADRVLDLTGGRGVDNVVEVGGAGTLTQSLHAAKTAGQVSVIGVVAGGGEINPLPLIPKALRLQGIYVGSRTMFEAMNAAFEMHGVTPVIDRTFAFADVPEAYADMPKGDHFGKLVISID